MAFKKKTDNSANCTIDSIVIVTVATYGHIQKPICLVCFWILEIRTEVNDRDFKELCIEN